MQNILSYALLSKNIKITIYRTIILPVVLYGCETWSVTLREGQAESFREYGVEEDIWPKKDEVTGEWRMEFLFALLHN